MKTVTYNPAILSTNNKVSATGTSIINVYNDIYRYPSFVFLHVPDEVNQQSGKSKHFFLFLHKLLHYMCHYLLIFFTAKPCICIGYLDCQLLGTLHNFFPLLARHIVGNFGSIALVSHQENLKFLTKNNQTWLWNSFETTPTVKLGSSFPIWMLDFILTSQENHSSYLV